MDKHVPDFLKQIAASGLEPFFNAIQCGMWDWNLENDELQFTPQCERFLGYDGNELPRLIDTLYSRLHPEDRNTVQSSVKAIVEGRESEGHREFRLLHKNGAYIWIQERFAVSKRDSKGHPQNITGMIYDITEIKHAELHEQAERRHLEEVKRLAGLGAWEWDLKDDYITYSENSTAILGRAVQDLNGPFEHLTQIMPSEQYERLRAGYDDYFARNDGSVFVMEFCAYDVQGRKKWMRNIANIVEWDEDGNPMTVRGGVLDIDETVRTREELKSALKKIEQYNKQLQADVVQAERTINAMFNASPQINILINDRMRAIDCNPAATAFFGFEDAKALLSWLNPPDDQEAVSIPGIPLAGRLRETAQTGHCEFTAEIPGKPAMNALMKRIVYGDTFAIVLYLAEWSEAEKRVQLMLDATPLACMLIDTHHHVMDCNKRFLDLIGVPTREAYQDLRVLYPEVQPDGSNSMEAMSRHIQEAFRTGEAAFDWTYLTAAGESLPMSVTMTRVQWRDSYCLVCFAHDMRDIMAEQEKVREAEAYTQMMLDSTPLICSIWDEHGRMIDCNLAALRYFELENKAAYIENFYALSPEYQPDGTSSRQSAKNHIKKTLKTGRQHFYWEYQTSKGELLPVETTLIRVDWHGAYRILAYSQDLREITSEREKAREATAYTQMMLDSTPLICSVWDENGQIIDCNLETVRLFGLQDKSEYISNFNDLNPALQPDGVPSREKANHMVARALESGYERFEWEYKTKSGEAIPVDVMLVRVPWKNGYRVLSYSRDLRAIRKADAAIQRYTNLLQVANKVASNLMAATPENFDESLAGQLKALGEAAGADRVHVWENKTQNGTVYYQQTSAWTKDTALEGLIPMCHEASYDQVPYLKAKVFASQIINSAVQDLPKEEHAVFARQGVKAMLIVPVVVSGEVWGFISFDNCANETLTPDIDTAVLQSSGIMIASAITRNRTTTNLIAAGQELQMDGRLLGAVNHVAEHLLASNVSDFTRVMQECLEILGKSVGSSRVSLWRNFVDEEGRLCSRRLPGWIDGLSYEQSSKEGVIDFASYVPEWDKGAVDRVDINLPLRDMNETLRNFAILQNSKSLLLVHIDINGAFWGFVGYAHDKEVRLLNQTEISILRSGGTMIASAIMRNEIHQKLMIATDEALASVRSKNEFLARMSHEIRTPMNAVIGMTTVAQKSEDMQKIKESLDVVAFSSQQLLSILNDILDMSNIDMEDLEIIRHPYDFEQMLENTIGAFLQQIEEKKLHFQYDLDRVFDRMIIGDEKRTSQIISSLLSNAIKFTSDGGTITLRIRESVLDNDAALLTIEMADNGIGIDKDFLPRIFGVFEQEDGSITRKYGGVGLGLSISKSLVTLMGGTIQVESEPGKGSRFTVTIPVALGEAPTERIGQAVLRTDLRILIVDDMPDVLTYFENVLASFSLDCEIARDAGTAIHKMKEADHEKRPFDVIFLDWYLHKGKSSAVIEQAGSLTYAPEIVIMSIADWSVIAKELDAFSATHFLPKPLLPSDIYNKLVELTYDKQRTQTALAQQTGTPDWHGKRVLLVEDIEINRMIAMELIADTGVEVECADNGEQAVEMVLANPDRYDLILMDMQMPVLDGLSATRQIRTSDVPGAKTIPIYAMTANAHKEDAEACIQAGMNGHIPKPIDIHVLYQAMNDAFSS